MFGRRCDLYPNRFNGNISLVSNAGWVLMVSIKNNNNRTEQPNIVSNFYWMTALIFSGKILLSTTRSFSFFTWRVSGAVMIDIFLVRYRCRFKITANTFHLYAAISLLLSRTHTHRQWNTLFHLFRRHRCNGRCFFFMRQCIWFSRVFVWILFCFFLKTKILVVLKSKTHRILYCSCNRDNVITRIYTHKVCSFVYTHTHGYTHANAMR